MIVVSLWVLLGDMALALIGGLFIGLGISSRPIVNSMPARDARGRFVKRTN